MEGERGESNPRPLGPQPSALTAELRPPSIVYLPCRCSSDRARPAGIEPATPSLEGSCSVRLSYGRMWRRVVGARGFEPPTPCAQGRCAIPGCATPRTDSDCSLTSLKGTAFLAHHGKNRKAHDGVREPSCASARNIGIMARMAWARWLIRSFSCAGSSASVQPCSGNWKSGS
jgi:hypothetical protein